MIERELLPGKPERKKIKPEQVLDIKQETLGNTGAGLRLAWCFRSIRTLKVQLQCEQLVRRHHGGWLHPPRRGHLFVHSSAFGAAAGQIKWWEVWRSACTVCCSLCSQLLPLQVRRASFTQPTPLKFFIRLRHDFLLGRRARLCLSACLCACVFLFGSLAVRARSSVCVRVCVCVRALVHSVLPGPPTH